MAPPKKQKREYTAGEFVWVKIKGYPIWPGQVEDIKNVKNEDVIKKKRKNAVLVKFLDETYTWAVHEDIKPLEKETFEDYVISPNHKNYKTWKEAFEKSCKDAGIDDAAVEQALNSRNNKKKREREADPETPNKKRKSASPSRKSPARKASTGGDKKTQSPKPKNSPRKSAAKKNVLNPILEGNENILKEFAVLLNQYQKDDDTQKLLKLLKVIENFAASDIAALQHSKIGKIIHKLVKSKDDKVKAIATRIYNYYDSLILDSVESKNKKDEEGEKKEEENNEVKEEAPSTTTEEAPKSEPTEVEEKKEVINENEEGEKKEEENNEVKEEAPSTITEEVPKSEPEPAPEAEKTETKEEDKMVIESEAKPTDSQDSTSSIIEASQ